ncbi:hypothetical protein GCM10020256_72530 [Streptomyces thermocoprophilus]
MGTSRTVPPGSTITGAGCPAAAMHSRAVDGVVHGVQAGGAEFGDLPAVGDAVAGEVRDEVVEMGEEFVRGQVDIGEGAYRHAQPAHGRRGRDAVAHDVADDEGDAAAGERDDVEPVAADPGEGAARQIAVGDLGGGLAGQSARQQAALQGERGAAFPGEAASVVDAHGGPAGHLLGEDGVVLGVRLGLGGAYRDGDTEGDAAGPQRHRDHRVGRFAVGAAPGGRGCCARRPTGGSRGRRRR